MPYKHYTAEERDALQTMVNMKLGKADMAVILGKHPSSVYRELMRNSDSGVYMGREAQLISAERRSHSGAHNTETEVVVLVVGAAVETIGNRAVGGTVEPTAAP